MFQFDSYTIDSIHNTDAIRLSELMVSNQDRFRRYFPKTLELNLSTKGSEAFIKQKTAQFDAKDEFVFVIKETMKVVGIVYIKELDWDKKQGEFAYCIDHRHTGKGVMTQAVKFLSAYAFESLGIEVLQIIAHKENLPSVMVAKNANFSWQKTLLKSYAPPNEEPLDMELYELYKKPKAKSK